VRVLKLAADTMESDVHGALLALLSTNERFGYVDVEARVRPIEPEIPSISIPAPDLHGYDALIGGASLTRESRHVTHRSYSYTDGSFAQKQRRLGCT